MGLIFFRSSLTFGWGEGSSADFWSWTYFATQFILLTKLDWKVFSLESSLFLELPVLVRATSKGSSNRYAALGPESRFEGKAEGRTCSEPLSLLSPMGPPPSLRALGWLASPLPPCLGFQCSYFLVPPFPGVERERGRPAEAQRLLQGASCGIAEVRALACFWKQWDVGIGAKQLTSSPQASCDQQGRAAYTTLRGFCGALLHLGGGGISAEKHFPSSWLNGHHVLFYSFILCPYCLSPTP